eukprot:g19110.t1
MEEFSDARNGLFMEEEKLPSNDVRAKDLSFKKGSNVAPQSAGEKKNVLKARSPDGEPEHVLGLADADLPDKAKKALDEKGVWEDLIAMPWCVVKRGATMGCEIKKHASGYNSYLITMAAPTPKQKDLLRPKDVCVKKYRYGKISKQLYVEFAMALNFSNVPFDAAVGYITGGSSRKFQFTFVDEPVLRFAPDQDVCTVEDIVLGGSGAPSTDDQYSFREFRELVEQKKIDRLAQLERLCTADRRLDQFLHGDGSNPGRPKSKLKSAFDSIQLRDRPDTVTLIGELLGADTKMGCKCKGRQTPAVKVWPKGLKWSDGTAPGEWAAGGVIVLWALAGRLGGNTLCFTGPTGTGKSWIIDMLRAALGEQYFDIPSGQGTYGLEQLGYDWPEKLMFALDELHLTKLGTWLTAGKPGYWKEWLAIQPHGQYELR